MAKTLIRKKLNIKILVKVDFLCAFTGTAFYLVLFNFLQTSLGLPIEIVTLQLIANTSYGLMGTLIYFNKSRPLFWFRGLVFMNFLYAFICIILGFFLDIETGLYGHWLLFAEGLFILALALVETYFLQTHLKSKA